MNSKKINQDLLIENIKKDLIRIECSKKDIARKHNILAKKYINVIVNSGLKDVSIARTLTKIRTALKHDNAIKNIQNHSYLTNLFKFKNNLNLQKKEFQILANSSLISFRHDKQLVLNSIDKRLKITSKIENINILKSLKKEIISLNIEPHFFKKFKKSADIVLNVQNVAKKRIEVYQTNNFNISLKLINQIIQDLLLSENLHDMILLCALSSGRRFIEIFSKNVCNFSKTNKKHEINIETNAKSKDLKIAKIPLLIPSSIFIDRMEKIRNNDYVLKVLNNVEIFHLDKQNKIISDRINSQININAKKRFNLDFITFKSSRPIYALISYEKYKKAGGNTKKELFFKNSLLHDDISTQLNYQQYNLIIDDDFLIIEDTKTTIERKKQSIEKSNHKNRLAGLKDLLKNDDLKKSAAQTDLLNFIINLVKNDPSIKIRYADFTKKNQKYDRSFGKSTIDKVYKLIKDFK